MDNQIVAIFCLCDDILKGLHHLEDRQCQMSDAEVMTTSIVSAVFFWRHMETARTFLKEQGYIPTMLEKIRFNRRQHRIAELFLVVFDLLAAIGRISISKAFTCWPVFQWQPVTTIEFRVRDAIAAKTGVAIKPVKNAISMG